MKKLLLACMLALGMGASAQISLGSGTTTGILPISTNWGYNYSQQIFTKNEINADAAGNITGVKFYLASASSITNSTTWKVYVGHTTKTTFSSTTDWVPTSTLTQVFDGEVSNVGGEVTVTFPTAFAYNNTDNLIIAVDENKLDYDAGNYFYTYSGVANSSIYYRSDSTNPNPDAPPTASSRVATKSRITFLGLTPNSVPSCPIITAPSAAAATGVAVLPTITWNAVSGATGYKLSVGTVAGGTDILNNQDLGNVTSYAFTTALEYNKQYFYTVSSYNGTVPSVACTERSFTTVNIPCPVVASPAANETNTVLSPTITWAAVTGATGYKLTVGTTAGGTDVLNDQDLGNVLTYTFASPLNLGTKYFYRVNSYNATTVSSSCTERNFTTICGVENAPTASQSFNSYVPTCWAVAKGAVAASSTLTYGTSKWAAESGFANTGSNPAVRINLYSTNPGDWLISQEINLGSTPGVYRVKYRMAVTSYLGTTSQSTLGTHVVRIIVSTDGGATWSDSNVIKTYTGTGTYSATGQTETVDLTGYSGNVKIAVVATTSSTTPDIDFHIDDFVVEAIPVCAEPSAVAASTVTSSSATLSWTAPVAAPANGYEYAYSTTNTAPASGTATTATSVPLSTLTPMTTYYYWVRSVCSGAASIWVTGSFTTPAIPPANDNCSNAIALIPGATFAQNVITTTNAGATSDGTAQSCQTNAVNNVWYSVVVPPSGSLTIETKEAAGSQYTDSVINVFSGACGSLTNVTGGCDDDGGDDAFSKVNLTGQTPGSTLLVSIWRWGGSTVFDGAFQVSAYDASLSTSEAVITKNEVKAYPNPFSDVLNISDIKNVKSISVIDLAGRVVKSFDKPSNTLQLSELNSGMYLVVLNMNDGTKQTLKAIKK
ncbi:T9SS type A sorting domain-containing protein [Chryseobacterium binzhouense]|uniref:T9SS type A sorting domain-containing protein n=1 Tax=Chryseobacterium binzhouense TaxID=2593646 RepID=UPI00289D2B80|nr:T9SS type A sorting domain-containing protein [Chryseobacterium binzhouense]